MPYGDARLALFSQVHDTRTALTEHKYIVLIRAEESFARPAR
jgi:hypothetical protein